MNTRSIRFRLTVWYAGLLTFLIVVFGIFVYITLDQFLERTLRDTMSTQAQTIGQTWLLEVAQNGDDYVIGEIDEHLAPRITGRFIRVTRSNGSVLYQSGPPHNGQFDPTAVSSHGPESFTAWREQNFPSGSVLLIHSMLFKDAVGDKYLIEIGAPYEQVEHVLHSLLLSLTIAFPIMVTLAIGGGYLFMKRALKPLDEIVTTAERITSRNLNERVPVVSTGDELEMLSVALNRMMARLEESFHHINRFSADAAHEIRTPLAIIRGELESALQTPGASAELRDRLTSALEEAERLSRIAGQLLEMSRLEAGETLIERTRFDLADLTRTTVEQMRLLAEEKDVRLQFDGLQPVEFDGDPIRLKQIVVNLVDNAIKYTAAGGSVFVSAFPQHGKAVLEVSDTGIGIPEHSLDQVFDRFYRADKARSRLLGGTGLGLAIVKSICTAYGGAVAVKSTIGKGTLFRVELPLTASVARID